MITRFSRTLDHKCMFPTLSNDCDLALCVGCSVLWNDEATPSYGATKQPSRRSNCSQYERKQIQYNSIRHWKSTSLTRCAVAHEHYVN